MKDLTALPKLSASHRQVLGFSLFFLLALCGLGLIACGNFTLDTPTPSHGLYRRVYVNDSSAADSLTSAIVKNGVKFVLQPGKSYQLSIATARSGDRLSVFYYGSNGLAGQYKTINGIQSGGHETYSLASDRGLAQFFLAQLITTDGPAAINSLGHVTLGSTAAIGADTLNLRLLFIHTLKNLRDSTAKAKFASDLFTAMQPIYTPFGIVIKGSFEIVEPTKVRTVLPFSGNFTSLPGTRRANNAHIYLVDSISVPDTGFGLAGQVLGFAPREVVDLDQDRESRVIIANPYTLNATVERLAITTAHELGHFFGLRHTVSTKNDLLQDNDDSNTEDGFTDTKFCNLEVNLAKTGAGIMVKSELGATVYCLRLINNSCNPNACELTNLMHPVDCGSLGQTLLSVQQAEFLKKNLATYRH